MTSVAFGDFGGFLGSNKCRVIFLLPWAGSHRTVTKVCLVTDQRTTVPKLYTPSTLYAHLLEFG